MPEAEVAAAPLRHPWRTGGATSLWRGRWLLWQLTVSVRSRRLRGTLLGKAWDYINPLVQFSVYFLVIGKLLGLERTVPNFPLYIFTGLTTVQYFIGGLQSATSSFESSRRTIRAAQFPREFLPASRLLSEFVALGPPLVILVIVALLFSWRPSLSSLAVAVLGIVLMACFTFGLGLLFGVANVFIRDTRQVVGVITTLARWAVPIIYPWTLVPDRFGDGLITTLYLANPVTIAVFGVREAFWHPTVDSPFPPIPLESVVVGVGITVFVVALGFVVVRRYQSRMVQRLRWTT